MPRFKELTLNGLTALAAASAIVVAGLRLREGTMVAGAHTMIPPRAIHNWREYTREGERLGGVGTPVTIVEFADYQCPFCKRAASVLREILAERPGQVSLIFRHFPLTSHGFSEAAARAAECASAQGRFAPYSDSLFSQSDSIGQKPWTRFAAEVGVPDSTAFSRCISDRSIVKSIERDRIAANRLALRGTPALLINGVLYSGFDGPDALRRQVAEAARSAKVQDKMTVRANP